MDFFTRGFESPSNYIWITRWNTQNGLVKLSNELVSFSESIQNGRMSSRPCIVTISGISPAPCRREILTAAQLDRCHFFILFIYVLSATSQ